MTVLIVFESHEGQTARIADFARQKAEALGRTVSVIDTAAEGAGASFAGVDRVILAAPVHQRHHPKAFEAFVTAHLAELDSCRTLLLSVSLSAAFPEGMEEANEYVVEMKMRTGFSPSAELLVAGAVRSSRYDYFAEQVVRWVVLRGRDFDPRDGEHEFTDWGALSRKLETFLA